ncbi:unnamed protein product [Linum trigynum]|uniref:Plant heme peroxidase family profile domain-containing protein n=1 Tax=Linum trigynum TaxID=586398 RepID=A0AAV2FL39_9ROSI
MQSLNIRPLTARNMKMGWLDSLTTMLIDLFAGYNLSVKDLVALSGSHSIGKDRCFAIQFCLFARYDGGS